VQRWLKFSKYLPSFGWEPVIVTVDPDFAAYPALDNTLESDIPAGVKVWKTRAIDYFRMYRKDKSKVPSAGFASSDKNGLTGRIMRFIRGNFFIPDPRRGWNSFAYRKACEIIEKEGIRHVITTSPPHSTQLIGMKLKKKYPGIRWIADLRDPWTDIYYYEMFTHTPPAKSLDALYERETIKKADHVITVGSSLRDIFSSRIPGSENKFTVISNGYDEEDFKEQAKESTGDFVITYAGTLSETYPLEGFLDASARYISKGNSMKIRFIGAISNSWKESVSGGAVSGYTEFLPHVDHHEAVKLMKESSALLLIIPDHRSNKSIITGKLFEYIASGRPVICLGPADGDAAMIINETRCGVVNNYNDIAGIENSISLIRAGAVKTDTRSALKYSRRSLTAKLVDLLGV